jgi:hypothetical protein
MHGRRTSCESGTACSVPKPVVIGLAGAMGWLVKQYGIS